MGNLLIYNLSFAWTDRAVDRNQLIFDLNVAISEAQNFKDTIHRTPNLFDPATDWGEFFYFLWTEGRNYEGFKSRYEWITISSFQILINILTIIQSATAKKAHDIQDLKAEFEFENNGWTGFLVPCQTLLVHDLPSWNEFHKVFVSTYDYRAKRGNLNYIKRFYKPELTEGVNSINGKIKRKQVIEIFKRLDDPTFISTDTTLHGEQIQMHFNDQSKSALNIDGTWKHNGFDIPKDAQYLLEYWGFLLPTKYYTS